MVIGVGFGNILFTERIIAIITPNSVPVRRMKEEAKKKGMLIDITQGRKTRSIIIMDSDHVVLSAISVNTIRERLERKCVGD
jgi:hypothetical protein